MSAGYERYLNKVIIILIITARMSLGGRKDSVSMVDVERSRRRQ